MNGITTWYNIIDDTNDTNSGVDTNVVVDCSVCSVWCIFFWDSFE